jgi:Arc/MetJ-type ribon-helix-helix transcriptional regulator
MTPSTKKPVSYHGISLPSPFIEQIKVYIQDKPEYRSVAEFVKEAVRQKMESERKLKQGGMYIYGETYPSDLTDKLPDISHDIIYRAVVDVISDLKEKKLIKFKK